MRYAEAWNNYRRLVAKTDERCREIREKYADHIACVKGCDECCRHISVFLTEAVAIALALSELPAEEARHIREKARAASHDGPCPLLEDGACLLYDARPIICRTHGFPMLITEDGGQRVDFCPSNFRSVTSLPADALIDLERLNQMLSVIDRVFIARYSDHPVKERFTIAEVCCEDFILPEAEEFRKN